MRASVKLLRRLESGRAPLLVGRGHSTHFSLMLFASVSREALLPVILSVNLSGTSNVPTLPASPIT